MIFVRQFLLISLIILVNYLKAQYFDTGQEPAFQKWRVIKTEHFKVIFPEIITAQALHTANNLESAYVKINFGLHAKKIKSPVILHPNSVVSNAMVPWAPKRMEFYTFPSQDDYPQPWLDQLPLHELRHLVQYSKINHGFTRALSFLFGEQITVGVFGTFVPLWFVEGDAVCAETTLSNSGRGRLPSFEMPLRAQILEKGIYSYNKAVFGSYKSFVPDKYILGYHIISTSAGSFSYDIWENAMKKVSTYPFMVTPFNYGLRKKSGMGKVKLYHFTSLRMYSLWKQQAEKTELSNFKYVKTKTNKFYNHYNKVHAVGDTGFVAVKSGMDDITRFILIDNEGMEKILFTPGNYFQSSLTYRKGKMIWAEQKSDIRWENRSYSILKCFDINTRKTRNLSSKTRYLSPDINKRGDRVVCVEQNINGTSSLVILGLPDGDIQKKIHADSGDYLIQPKWANNDEEIVYIALNRYGKRLCLANKDGQKYDLGRPSFSDISQPAKHGNDIYFVGAYSGVNNIFVLQLPDTVVYQITSSEYGVKDPYVSDDGQQLLYSDYTANGYKPVIVNIDSLRFLPFDSVNNSSVKLYENIGKIVEKVDLYGQPAKKYQIKKYSGLKRLFNVHSWGPLSIDADNTTIKPGFEILSQNLLSTLFLAVGFENEWLNNNRQIYAKVSYRGLFPRFDFLFGYQWLRTNENLIRWNVLYAKFNISVPLNLSSGKYYRRLQPYVSYSYYDLIGIKNFPTENLPDYYNVFGYGLLFYNMLKTSEKDLAPRFGQLVQVQFRHTPFESKAPGNIFAAESRLYFPGLFRHHSLNTYIAYQQNNGGEFLFQDIIALPAGIGNLNGLKDVWSFKINYELPLFYPDWSIGSLFYFKRFRSAMHFDFCNVTDYQKANGNFYSTGLSLLTDFHFLRFVAPLSIGCRVNYAIKGHSIQTPFSIELLYSINFDRIYFRPYFSRIND